MNAFVEFVDANGDVTSAMLDEDLLRQELDHDGGRYGVLDVYVTAAVTCAVYGHIEEL